MSFLQDRVAKNRLGKTLYQSVHIVTEESRKPERETGGKGKWKNRSDGNIKSWRGMKPAIMKNEDDKSNDN